MAQPELSPLARGFLRYVGSQFRGPTLKRAPLPTVSDVVEHRTDGRKSALNDEQLVALRKAVEGTAFYGPDGRGFEAFKTLVEFTTSISPQFCADITKSLTESAHRRAAEGRG